MVCRFDEWDLIEVHNVDIKFYIISVYLNYCTWDQDFSKLLNFLSLFHEKYILAGDMNVRLAERQVISEYILPEKC